MTKVHKLHAWMQKLYSDSVLCMRMYDKDVLRNELRRISNTLKECQKQ